MCRDIAKLSTELEDLKSVSGNRNRGDKDSELSWSRVQEEEGGDQETASARPKSMRSIATSARNSLLLGANEREEELRRAASMHVVTAEVHKSSAKNDYEQKQ